jgi:hypothetical protein
LGFVEEVSAGIELANIISIPEDTDHCSGNITIILGVKLG